MIEPTHWPDRYGNPDTYYDDEDERESAEDREDRKADRAYERSKESE